MRKFQICIFLAVITKIAVAFSLSKLPTQFNSLSPNRHVESRALRNSLHHASSARYSRRHTPTIEGILRGGAGGISAIANDGTDFPHQDNEAHEKHSTNDRLYKGLMAFLAVAATSGLACVIEQGGTYAILSGLKYATGVSTFTELVDYLMVWAQQSGWTGLALSGLASAGLQILPLFNGILLAAGLGAMHGTWKGLLAASFGATASSVVCLLISRYAISDVLASKSEGKMPPVLTAVAASISASQRKSLGLVALFRLSPVIPFCWSNYLFGLTPVSLLPYALGTFAGTLPSLAVFVSAGVVGKAMASGSLAPPPGLLAVGGVATLLVLTILGRISQQELNKMADHEPPS
mmetsp:Transcript_45234/g.92324  ORF Transcript_45234/g.92324 Transcript_45234/m.92324 type:complete len:350 (-) Transcript_45234:35-1084(-)